MEPVIRSASRLAIEPIDPGGIEVGDIVMARVGDETMLHLAKTVDRERRRAEISDPLAPGERMDAL
jgi:hypothetical protein